MADMLVVRDEYPGAELGAAHSGVDSSGLTKREFCQQRAISEKSFYYWLRKLLSQMTEPYRLQLVQFPRLFQRICCRSNTEVQN